ncbi:hypothetical protein [Arthrobacter sp. ISL-69]|uniref:hypothetical protein n=1 Tax=Arthrobacter sp. ISL-69 TaxID=2819113 RepID=UPI001BE824C6|nr:hypothetical protein [Arthrobacter sp. ISL-69]MBT2537198.1 hypothetical protein [Arthrobacter sp. ISL-69]
MTNYHFTGAHPRVLAGLSQGVNATITPADGDAPPHGATLEARLGDAVRTDEPYEHPELAEVIEEEPPVDEDGSPIPVPKPPKPSSKSRPAPADPTE